VLLTRHGRREWGFATVVLLLSGIPAMLAGWWWALIPLGLAWIAVAGFFRDPLFRRPASDDPKDLISPADGRISRVERVTSHPSTDDGPAIIVRIFLSVLDVHLNRAPAAAEVVSIVHTPGRYLDARSEESAQVNESNLISLRTELGVPIGVRQISGAIARRIVCPIGVGDRLERAARFGMIKFGSTTELIVPDAPGTEVRVREGDRVTGGVTILVRLPE
jgi:phosphatidylserine decarboxylase